MYGYIYKTTNIINGLIYIGKHESSCFEPNRYIGSGKLLKQAIKEFGKKSFLCEMIDTAETLNELLEKEKYWIEKFDARNPSIGYNILEGGSGCFGVIFSEEEKERRSKFMTEQNLNRNPEFYKKVAEKHRGNKLMNNGEKQIWVHKEDIEKYLNNGWKIGTCKKRNRVYEKGKAWKEKYWNEKYAKIRKDRIWIHKEEIRKWIKKDELQKYLDDGWLLGMK